MDDERIVAAGDSAAPSDLPLRMSCQAAMPLGARAADTVLSRIAGEQPSTLNQVFAGQCISLGRRAGIFQFAHRYDIAMWFHIDGRPGAKLKEFVCRGTVKQLADEARKPGSYSLHRVQEAPSASSCCRPGAARRRPPLNGQPSVPRNGCRCVHRGIRIGASQVASCAGWCLTPDRTNPVGRIEPRPTKEDLAVDAMREGLRPPWPAAEERARDVSDHATDPATEAFVAHRNLLFTVAYEMLGSAADAEDVLQETWLRWVKVDLGQVRDQRAYLVRITTRQSLNRLRTMKRRKEAYVGPWLPEPLLTAPDVAEDVELAESVSMALMLVLETLSPTERAVFVLREAFDVSYDEIAAAVDKSPAAVRQIAHRARRHVDARRPREVVSPSETRAALESFQRAVETGDLQGLLDVLAPEVVLVSDGGGVKQAALRPIIGAEKVVRFIVGGLGKTEGTLTADPTVVNGNPALVLRLDGEIDGVMAIRVEDARITGLYYVRNPEKLSRVESETPLTLR